MDSKQLVKVIELMILVAVLIATMLAHSFILTRQVIKAKRTDTVVHLMTEISSAHTKLLTNHEDKIATGGDHIED